jgi:micrococcal nuclease
MYQYKAKVIRIVDGDTLEVELDLGFSIKLKERLRLDGVDTPEIYGVLKESNTYAEGMVAFALTKEWLEKTNYEIVVETFKKEKYGRYLAKVFSTIDSKSLTLNEFLISRGYVYK